MKTGRIVTGSVLDCNKKYFERALKDYDPLLYIKWNPEKLGGMGCWELRRRPEQKTAVPRWELNGQIVFELQYAESDIVHHIMDMPHLSYDAITKLREMDTWNSQDWVADLEYREQKAQDKERADNRAEMRYAVKQYKRAFKDFKEAILSGRNPADFLAGNW